jgi:DNA-binding NarL/FixJ family response regulator
MAISRHIFLTQRAEPLPRWLEAFPNAEILKPGAMAARPDALVWLHLDPTRVDIADQVRTVVSTAFGNPVVTLSNQPNDSEGLACLEAGAVGYISALAVPDMMRQVVSVVENGGLWVGPRLMMRLRAALAGQRPFLGEADKLTALSQREKEVALAVAAGASNKEIARIMGITERTVKAHLSAIFERLKIGNRVQLSILVNGERQTVNEAVH